jgi:hypothetical protein
MVRTYHGVALDHTADEVWAVVRRFDRQEWSGIKAGAGVEDGMLGNEAGAMKSLQQDGKQIFERLIAHSDVNRSYVYEYHEPAFLPISSYRATISVYPIVETAKAFVEWWADLDDVTGDNGQPIGEVLNRGFAKSLISLRSFMASRNAERVLSSILQDRRNVPHSDRVILRLV